MRVVRTLCQHPSCFRLQPQIFEYIFDIDARPLCTTHHTFGKLDRVELRSSPLRSTVCRTLDKVDSAHAWISLELIHRQYQCFLHETVDHQTMLIGVDMCDTPVCTTEKQAVWCDDTFHILDRTHRDRSLPVT
ncbi:hypothetical protein D1872_296150 [compost metagenome]